MPGILITGGSGYLGAALLRLAPEAIGTRFSSVGPLVQLDVRDPGGVNALVRRIRPEVIIHTAYTTSAEDNWETTTSGAQNVARSAASVGARLVHLSTDVVFDGTTGPYREGDTVNPITAYGRAKADAEQMVMAAHPTALIVRTSLLYGGPSNEGAQEMLVREALDGDAISFFTDEIRSPIAVQDLAEAILELVPQTVTGVINVAGPDGINRHELAGHLAESLGLSRNELRPASSHGLSTPRPQNCALDSTRAYALLARTPRGVRAVLTV